MPSLPELEVYKAQLLPQLAGRPIEQVEALDYRVVRADAESLEGLLLGSAIIGLDRYGKWLIWDAGAADRQLIMHLGLTGKIRLLAPVDKLPRFSAFTLHFAGGTRLVLSDSRKLGKVYVRNFDDLKAEKTLGPDLLTIDEDYFVQTLRRKKRGARDVLMDQKIIAGIGGKYADEILWQARLHPNTKLDRLSAEELKNLYQLVMSVTRTAISLDGDVDRFPSDWLIPHRRTDQTCPRCGTALTEHSSVFHCPHCQPAPNPYRRG